MEQNEADMIRRLQKPVGPVDVVLDTDTYNEIDDQYALAYLIRSNDKLNLKAVYAAPFFNARVKSPGEGMEKSYLEIEKVLTLMNESHRMEHVYKGSEQYLKDEKNPVLSPAASDLVSRAKGYSSENPLYVIAIGAITNIASAILLDPSIIDRMVVVWLGGNSYHWTDNMEFNLKQDVAAARIVFGCGVPLIQLPCKGVVSSFTVSGPELDYWLKGKNPLCDYLVEVTRQEAERCYSWQTWTRPIWDVTAVAWLLDGDFMLERLEHSPIPEYDHRYAFDPTRHFIKYVYHIKRDKLLEDMVKKLAGGI